MLRYAIAASIALHAALLFGLPRLQQAFVPPAPPPLQGRLVEKPAAEVRPPAPEVRPPAPAPAVPAKPQRPMQTAKPAAKAVEPIAPAPPAPAPAATPSPAPPAAPAPPAQSVASAAAAPLAPAAEPMDTRLLGEYRMDLIGAARRYKRYPAIARENNWTGDVLVGVAVGADGRARVSVKAGSGHQVLDQQALDMFSQAVRAVSVPAALRGKPFALEVRAIYGFED